MSFNENRELVGEFDIVNLVIFPNNSFIRMKLGELNPQRFEEQILTIHENHIFWPEIYNQV